MAYQRLVPVHQQYRRSSLLRDAGTRCAPAERFITAIVLTVIFSVFNGAIIMLAFQNADRLSALIWWLVVSMIFGLVATIVCCFLIHEEEQEAGSLQRRTTTEPTTIRPTVV